MTESTDQRPFLVFSPSQYTFDISNITNFAGDQSSG